MARITFAAFIAALLATTVAAQENPRPIVGGNLPATTVQLPTFGVSIDADGVLDAKLFRSPDQQLINERWAAAKNAKPGEWGAESKLRKVSLRRWEAAWLNRPKGGDELQALEHLAGLTAVQYVFCYPATADAPGDVVLAGPAEPFANDAAGRAIGLKSGRPILSAADLATAIRAFPPGNHQRPFLGCTIDPPPEGLAKFLEFQKTIPRSIRDDQRSAAADAMRQGIATALGLAEIRVFGVSPRTRFARTLIEADYRMKRIAVGVEPPPIKMVTFVSALESPQQGTLQRWWFTPDYKCLKVAPDKLAVEFVGRGVRLQTEDKIIGADGSLIPKGAKPNGASDAFVTAFTKKYPEIAGASPIYAELRAVIDLAVTAAVLRRHDFYRQANWHAAVLRDEAQLKTESGDEPKRAPCVVNALWKGNRLFAPAGGGVSMHPDEALNAENLLDDQHAPAAKLREELRERVGQTAWWWD